MPGPNVTSRYTPTGATLSVDPAAASVIPPLTARDQLQAIIDAEKGPQPRSSMRRATPMPRRAPAPYLPSGLASMTKGGGGEGGMKAGITPTWYASQGAAMRPVGLGPGMIPGMGIDPRFLPPSMRPSGSSFQETAENRANAELEAMDEAVSRSRMEADRSRFRTSRY